MIDNARSGLDPTTGDETVVLVEAQSRGNREIAEFKGICLPCRRPTA